MGHTVGIDFGMTRSAVAHVPTDRTRPAIIHNGQGEPTTPSAVYYGESGDALVGTPAQDNGILKPDRYVDGIKRHLGRDVTFDLGGRSRTPEEVAARILDKLVADAGERIGTEVTDAVVAVPAAFTNEQRRAVVEAGDLAGVSVDALLSEPGAAVLAYGLWKQRLIAGGEETVLAYDLGSGGFSVSLVRAEYDHNYVETVATESDAELGGADWTAALADLLFDRIEAETGVDLRTHEGNDDQRVRVRDAAQEAKHRLSERSETRVTVPYVIPSEGYNLDIELTREQFRKATAALLDATRDHVDRLFRRIEATVDDVDTALLVGGGSHMPQVEAFLEEYVGRQPSTEVDPARATAYGAAIYASLIGQEDRTALGYEADTTDGLVLIDALPRTFSIVTRDRDGTKAVTPVIERDTRLPASNRVKGFGVPDRNRTEIRTPVMQGESGNPDEDDFVGELRITDVPDRDPSGVHIAVTFEVDVDGVLSARAMNLVDRTELPTDVVPWSEVDHPVPADEWLPTL